MLTNRRYIEFLEKENQALKDQVKSLVNSLFAVQGAPPPFVPPVVEEEPAHIVRHRTQDWLAKLEEAANGGSN